MMNDGSIPVPEKLKSRPVFRGFPVPITAAVIDGTPDFRVTDEKARINCMVNKLCGLCGEKIDGMFSFMGGEICSKQKIFYDPAMHEECAAYAMAVCPYFALKNHGFGDPDQIKKKHEGSGMAIVDLEHRAPKPERMMIMDAGGFQLIANAEDPNKTIYSYAENVRLIHWFRWNEKGRSEFEKNETVSL